MLATSPDNATLAKPIAAEDLRRGDYVALLNEVVEFPSFLWCSDSHLVPPQEPVRVLFRALDQGRPLRVRAVCLPFVLVTLPCGRPNSLDVRGCRLVRLDKHYAREVCKAINGKNRQKKKKRKNRRRAK